MSSYIISTAVTTLFAIIIVFFGHKNPAVTWAWLAVVVLIPYVGFFCYLLVGIENRRYRIFLKKSNGDELLWAGIRDEKLKGLSFHGNQKAESNDNKILNLENADYLEDLFFLNFTGGSGALTDNNEITPFFEGVSMLENMMDDIKHAKKYIHLLYYIYRGDSMGLVIMNELCKKASEGVEVRMMVDGMGSQATGANFFKQLVKAGGEVTVFMPPLLTRINFRNHRKIMIVDGEIGYIGGFNIGDEYMGRHKKFGFWRDTHIRIFGDAAKELNIRFLMDWNFFTKNKLTNNLERFFPVLPPKPGGVKIQIVSSGPDTRFNSIHYGYARMIMKATKSIYIETPYFVPDDCIRESLKMAALSGIDVRIIIPAHPDHVFVYHASLSNLGELLEAGVKCYQYETGFIHSKMLIIDGLVSSVGSANMDVRSFKMNFEINAFIYDKKTVEIFTRQFLEDINASNPILPEDYRSRPITVKFREAVARMISPLL